MMDTAGTTTSAAAKRASDDGVRTHRSAGKRQAIAAGLLAVTLSVFLLEFTRTVAALEEGPLSAPVETAVPVSGEVGNPGPPALTV